MYKHTEAYLKIKKISLEKKTKICKRCGQEKPKDLFTSAPKNKDGKYSYCFDCERVRKADLYKNNPKSFYKRTFEWQRNNPEKCAVHNAIRYALKKGKINKPLECSICNKSGRRIEAHHWRGYSKENRLNIQWLCHSCHVKSRIML